MKKSLTALAVLAVAGAASAQSSVTLFGLIDATYQNLRGDGNSSLSRLHNSGYSSSRLGFRGTEDLGGGMSASFWLEAGMGNDSGTGGATNTNNQTSGGALAGIGGGQGLTFARRSTVSLAGGWGELRVGRDYVPTFWNLVRFDPFGLNGSGQAGNLMIGAGLGTTRSADLVTAARASNSIGYFLPNKLGGFYGQAMYAMGENPSNAAAGTESDGNHWGARLGYDTGPFSVAVSYGNTVRAAGDYRAMNLGGSWDFGVAKVMAQYARDEIKAAVTAVQTSWLLGSRIPMGAGEIRLSYISADVANKDGADELAVGYVYNLSKRTALYTTYARVNNKGSGVLFHNGRAATAAGGSTTGLDIGVRHSF
jgi:predicted porin